MHRSWYDESEQQPHRLEDAPMFPVGDDNPTRRVPVINWLLIMLTIVVFALQWSGGEEFILRWSFIPARLNALLMLNGNPQVIITIFTAMFMHAGLAHIAGNLLFLWIFGDNVEDIFGRARYLLFYLL